MKEIWKDVIGFEGIYKISSFGNLKNKKRLLTNTLDKDGYVRNSLYKNGKVKHTKRHRLVAIAFIKNPLNKKSVNHIDGNKLNNNISNLEWATHQEQEIHAYKNGLKFADRGENHFYSKLKTEEVLKIHELANSGKYTNVEIAKLFNIKDCTVSNIKLKKCWKHLFKEKNG